MAKLQSTKGGASPSIQGIKRTKTTTPEKSFRFMLLGVSIPRILARWQSSYPWIKNLPETNADQTMSRPPGRSKVVSPGNVSRAGTSGPNPTPVASATTQPITRAISSCTCASTWTRGNGPNPTPVASATTQPITRAISTSTCVPTWIRGSGPNSTPVAVRLHNR